MYSGGASLAGCRFSLAVPLPFQLGLRLSAGGDALVGGARCLKEPQLPLKGDKFMLPFHISRRTLHSFRSPLKRSIDIYYVLLVPSTIRA